MCVRARARVCVGEVYYCAPSSSHFAIALFTSTKISPASAGLLYFDAWSGWMIRHALWYCLFNFFGSIMSPTFTGFHFAFSFDPSGKIFCKDDSRAMRLCKRLLREGCRPRVWRVHQICPLYKCASACSPLEDCRKNHWQRFRFFFPAHAARRCTHRP